MDVIRLGSLDIITDERVRLAAEAFERETGERLVEEFGRRLNDPLLELYLIMRGYPARPVPSDGPAEPHNPTDD